MLPPAKPDLLKAARTDLRQLIVAHHDEFGGLTDTRADTVARQQLLGSKSIDRVGTPMWAALAMTSCSTSSLIVPFTDLCSSTSRPHE
jgi:hypothetical protein